MDVIINSCKTEEDSIKICRESDFIITVVRLYPFGPEVLKKSVKCRFIQTLGIDHSAISKQVATEQGICVMNNAGFVKEELSDHAMALLLACARNIVDLNSKVKSGELTVSASPEYLKKMTMLRGKTLGIIGFGHSGKAMVPKAKAFGMEIITYSPHVDARIAQEFGVKRVSLEELFENSDFISLHAILNDNTKNMIRIEHFKKMKPSAYIINIARGALIKESDLYIALKEGLIAGAGLDVTDPDPPTPDCPLLRFNNVILTGHQAGNSPESANEMWETPLKQVSAVLQGQWPINIVNPEVKGIFLKKWGSVS
ncbi:MAG: C-terminal binding protein [Deltaproteobacteria bacterium]|nr:C-terminal binding protein [Deltaproteobacteria bacterium]